MNAARIATAIFATGLAISTMLIAQTAPDITLPAGDTNRGKAIFESSKGNLFVFALRQ